MSCLWVTHDPTQPARVGGKKLILGLSLFLVFSSSEGKISISVSRWEKERSNCIYFRRGPS